MHMHNYVILFKTYVYKSDLFYIIPHIVNQPMIDKSQPESLEPSEHLFY
jgi:hypothetical protein